MRSSSSISMIVFSRSMASEIKMHAGGDALFAVPSTGFPEAVGSKRAALPVFNRGDNSQCDARLRVPAQ